jgi:hypothetical protein
MKKMIIPIAFIALTVASCKKDYTCVCTDDKGGETKTFKSISSRQAHANCTSTTHTDSGGTGSETCTLQ